MSLPADLPICVDGRMLAGEGTGVTTYTRALIAAASQMGGRFSQLSATHVQDGYMRRWAGALAGATLLSRRAAVPGGRDLLVGRDIFRRAHVHFGLTCSLYRLRAPGPAGIMHWTYPVPLWMEGWINLYTVHDAIPITRPDLTPIRPARHRAVLSAVLAKAACLVTVSEAARAEIVDALGCDPARVVNCSQPVELAQESFERPQVEDAPGGYLLYCGALEPRKNLVRLLQGYAESGVTLPLLIVGPEGWRAAPILEAIAATRGARRLPYQSRAELLGLIAGARALVFPSLAEGFGLPVAEAMALGTPVMTSDRGALAEVAGGAALLIDPESSAAISAGLIRLTEDDALSARLSELGRRRASDFSNATFVARISALYASLFARPPV